MFDFDNWDARAVYFEDPAGNIVELIAHHGLEENDRMGRSRRSELVGFSELGLVGDLLACCESSRRSASSSGTERWKATGGSASSANAGAY